MFYNVKNRNKNLAEGNQEVSMKSFCKIINLKKQMPMK